MPNKAAILPSCFESFPPKQLTAPPPRPIAGCETGLTNLTTYNMASPNSSTERIATNCLDAGPQTRHKDRCFR